MTVDDFFFLVYAGSELHAVEVASAVMAAAIGAVMREVLGVGIALG